MKVLITGSRSITDRALIEEALNKLPISLLIHGGAIGVDTIAGQIANEKGIEQHIIRPDYDRYGRSAPLIRNKVMVDLSQAVIGVWDGVSKGTKYTLDYAREQGKEVILCFYNSKNTI